MADLIVQFLAVVLNMQTPLVVRCAVFRMVTEGTRISDAQSLHAAYVSLTEDGRDREKMALLSAFIRTLLRYSDVVVIATLDLLCTSIYISI